MRMCGVQNVEQVMGEKFTCNMFEEGEREEGDNSGKSEPSATFFFSTGGIDIMREYLIKLDINVSTSSAISFTENEVYRV